MALFVGIDLSGPSNSSDTAVACFRESDRGLAPVCSGLGVDDIRLVELFGSFDMNEPVTVGLDAPLSYNPGGGDRKSDRELRKVLVSRGLKSGSVMTPTMTRMVYLTLRGMAVARAISLVVPHADVLEIHPGGTMVLHGAPAAAIVDMKQSASARAELVGWLLENGFASPEHALESDHMVAATACALGAWKWKHNASQWLFRKEPPLHPFDYAC